MIMTNEEIVRDYRVAKNRTKQIGILADVNMCSKREIVEILLEMGEEVPGNFLSKGKKKAAVPEEEEPEQENPKQEEPKKTGLTVYGLMEILQQLFDAGYRDLPIFIDGVGSCVDGYQVFLDGDGRPREVCLIFKEANE